MKHLFIASIALLAATSAQAKTIYPTHDAAFRACKNDRVAVSYSLRDFTFVKEGWICVSQQDRAKDRDQQVTKEAPSKPEPSRESPGTDGNDGGDGGEGGNDTSGRD